MAKGRHRNWDKIGFQPVRYFFALLITSLLFVSNIEAAQASSQEVPHHSLAKAVDQLLDSLTPKNSLALMEVRDKHGTSRQSEILFHELDSLLTRGALARQLIIVDRSGLQLLFKEWALADNTGASGQGMERQLSGADYFIIAQIREHSQGQICTLKAIKISSGTVAALSESWLDSPPLISPGAKQTRDGVVEPAVFIEESTAPWRFPEISPPLSYTKNQTLRHSQRATASKMSEACDKATKAIVLEFFKGKHPTEQTYRQAVYQANCTMVKTLPNGKKRVEVTIEFYESSP